jgi:cytochrome c-type biogenesis protein CcmH
MIWFWSAAGLLLGAVLAVLLRPLVRQPRGGGESGETIAVFRRQLAELDADAAQGRLAPETADAARYEVARRLLLTADIEAAGAAPAAIGQAETSWRIGAAVGVAAVLPAAAIAIYLWVGAPFAIGGSARVDTALQAHEERELQAAADALAARTKADPGNLEDWLMLGRTLGALERFAEAREAYRRALALAPGRPELHAELGEILVLESQGVVTQAALAEFAKADKDPRARYYTAEAALQQGDTEKGIGLLHALLAEAPAEAPWRQAIVDRLAQIAPGMAPAVSAGPTAAAPPVPAPPVPGPTARDVAAAQTMAPEAQAAMIRGMVARLAARLEQHPDDKEGWARLAHAYDVLGEPDKAENARRRAGAAAPR